MVKYKQHLLFCAVLLFGFLSEPTPEQMGIPEILMLFCLVLSISYERLIRNIFFYKSGFYFSQVTIFVVLIWPLFGLVIFLNDERQAIRDLISACFICLPFFIAKIDKRELEILHFLVFVAGLSFALREFNNFQLIDLMDLGARNMIVDQRYLLQDPIVLYSALFSIGKLVEAFQRKDPKYVVIFTITLLVVASSFLLQGLRLNIMLVALYSIYSISNLSSMFAKLLYGVFILIFIFFFSLNPEIFSYFFAKLRAVGDNGKIDEALEVIFLMSEPSALLGYGFGGEFFSPTYESYVNFTHSFFTYLILKSGVLGFFYALMFTVFMTFWGTQVFRSGSSTLQASMMSLLPALLTQPTYKSFGFGLIALIVYKTYKSGIR